MLRLRHHRLVLGLLAFLAIGWAQTSGLHRGFMCDCGGVEHLSQVDHCHGPHSAACHEDEDHDAAPDHEEDGREGRHDHAVVVDSLLAMQQQEAVLDVAPRFQLVQTLDLEEKLRMPVIGVRAVLETPLRRSRLAHEWPWRLSQIIALRV